MTNGADCSSPAADTAGSCKGEAQQQCANCEAGTCDVHAKCSSPAEGQ